MRRWLGCDPGASGAIAMIPEEGEVEIYELTDETLISLLRDWQWDDCICAVEEVSSSPQMGVKSAFSFGGSYKGVLMALKCFSIPFATVKPQKWKAEFGCNLGRQATPAQKKSKDIEACRRLYPTVSLKRTAKCKVDHDGFADALLIATYAKRKL